MPKFLLIDQSIEHSGGHHYEYAKRVLRAAEKAGYVPVLATHRRFTKASQGTWECHPTYQLGFWDSGASPTASHAHGSFSLTRWRQRLRARLQYSTLALMWEHRHEPETLLHSLRSIPHGLWLVVPLLALQHAWKLGSATGELVRSLLPVGPYLARVSRAFEKWLSVVFLPILLVLRPRPWLKQRILHSRKSRTFCQDTTRLLKACQLGRDDIVFVPTLDENEMLGILDCFQRFPPSAEPNWHLLFRRNIFEGHAPEYPSQITQHTDLHASLSRLQHETENLRVHLWTDTEELTTQYNAFNTVEFQTLPIPVGEEYRPSGTRRENATRFIYVGDARSEKGYPRLPRLIQDLLADDAATHRLEFAIQSNFNLRGGDPGSAVARAQLETLPTRSVQILTEPLDSSAYCELTLSGDACLVLYDPAAYAARSSGILVEALCAGIPVIVPASTWMSVQLNLAISRYHRSLDQAIPTLEGVEIDSQSWLEHGGNNRVRLRNGRLPMSRQDTRYCWVDVPADSNASHFSLHFEQNAPVDGIFTQITVDQLDAHGNSARQDIEIVGGLSQCPGSVLIELHSETRRIWVGLRNAHAETAYSIGEIRGRLLRSPTTLPRWAVGSVYSGPDRILESALDLVRHTDHYRQTARAFSNDWTPYHNSDSLVSRLQSPHEEPVASSPSYPSPEAPAT
ncbi:hypothetical protein MK489_24760 [Myxococcota bacterium]|nr:hypothetical protein [Myxococcota bacterium]